MKVAITGASGFIGRYVVAELESLQAITTTLVVRPSTVLSSLSLQSNIVKIDLQNFPLDSYELMGSPDVLIHLAWHGLPNYKSLDHFQDELPNQFRLLRRLIESGLKTLVVTGTCFEYGMQSGSLREDLQPQPTTPYGFAKNTLRCQLEYLQQVKPFNLTWARLFYIYGDGQAENSLFPQLKRAIERKDNAFNMSGGEQLRDYLPVRDVAKYLVALAMTKQDSGIVNICSGRPISVRKLVENWIKENGWSIDIQLGYYPYPDYEPMAFWGDSQKLNRCLEM
ncbi:dTDP-6-deoxy-L-talose 4-dehydrogenase (NAD(+)) [Tumidithrix helvetica PCC 7403]|uniref:NAD-dependent epimerase/dehydratase family protein n=1 Tax=Tumidithrix helvetica TaxID=3457545 RepID=UPI003C8BC760